jgi:hypothetical protein
MCANAPNVANKTLLQMATAHSGNIVLMQKVARTLADVAQPRRLTQNISVTPNRWRISP